MSLIQRKERQKEKQLEDSKKEGKGLQFNKSTIRDKNKRSMK